MEQENENQFVKPEENDKPEETQVTAEQEASIFQAFRDGEELTFEQLKMVRVMSKRQEEAKCRWCEEHGIIRQVLFDNVCRTTPAHIENILKQTFDRLKFSNLALAEEFDIARWFTGQTLELKVVYSRLGNFGGLGTIYVTPVNDIEARIELICEGVLAPFMDWEDGQKLYWQTMSIIQTLAEELCRLFNFPSESTKMNKASSTTQSHPPAGRPPDPQYEKAFSVVQGYLKENGFTNAQAIRQAYNDCVKQGEIDDDIIDFKMFTSAMKTRLNKLRSK